MVSDSASGERMNVKNCFPVSIVVLIALSAAPALGASQPSRVDSPPKPGTTQPSENDSEGQAAELLPEIPNSQIFDRLLVTGGEKGLSRIPGSAEFIGADRLQQHGYSDVHRVLRQSTGVVIQEEDGYGLRPNIGMRGTGVERSQKITLLEDGVLIAPAPYSASAAYYFPTVGRMEAIEVRKGSIAIEQGPYTTGGAINLVTTSIPSQLGGRAELSVGEDKTSKIHGFVGDSRERLGWLVEGFRFDTDGFKHLDGDGSTGTKVDDYVGKFRFNSRPGADRYQALEVKLGRTEQFGNETYLGLTQADFENSPLRRYAGSQADYITTRHDLSQVRYLAQPTRRFFMTATAYRNDFFRNWHKLQSVAGFDISSVLASPKAFPLELGVLRGEIDDLTGGLRIRNNRREYRSEGFDTKMSWTFDRRHVRQHIEFGLRQHRDWEDRFQEEDSWNMVDGQMSLLALGEPGSQSNRITRADATALFLRNEVSMGRFTLNAGLRLESIDFDRMDFGHADPTRTHADLKSVSNGVNVLIPGLGMSAKLNDSWILFGGAHKGFAPPGAGQNRATRSEESLNYELGVRQAKRNWKSNVVAFVSDYDNLLGSDSLASGGDGTGDQFNGGGVLVHGLEAGVEFDAGAHFDTQFAVPIRFTYTYTEAEFRTSFETQFADWAPAVVAGDRLPYLPENQLSASIGLVFPQWDLYLNVAAGDEMRTRAGQGAIPAGEGTESSLVIDMTAGFQLSENIRILAQGRNLFDDTYVAARRPAGARPGLPRTLLAGLNWIF
jgi:Fe(3+) dicitrate transport protein